MPHVITQACCNDASCVPVCPVGCIHPGPTEAGYATTDMLYIDPATCIDCGVCVSACPVDAIKPERLLAGTSARYRDINAAYYEQSPIMQSLDPVVVPASPTMARPNTLRVAIVGSGPAGSYAAAAVLNYPNTEVNVFDRLPTPWGLIRAGVAPDHPQTKEVSNLFERSADDGRLHLYLNVEVGRHLDHSDLMSHHHAVIYAYGSSESRRLDIPGEDLPGSCAAMEFVNWYNGHPDFSDFAFDLSCKRAVIVGNGNVALDVARILVVDPDVLARTDMADYAVSALRASNIEEVVVLGRRGPAQAAYTAPELLSLGDLAGVDVVIDDRGLSSQRPGYGAASELAPSIRTKSAIAAEFASRETTFGNRKIVMSYLSSPTEIIGRGRVSGLRVVRNRLEVSEQGVVQARETDEQETIEAGLVLSCVGYQGRPIPGLPFDTLLGVLSNDVGRVVHPDTRETMTGVYTAGWIKRGSTGVIGTNRRCATETVDGLVDDFSAGRLTDPTCTADALSALVTERQPDAIDKAGWRAIDAVERDHGRAHTRPRRKLTRTSDLLAASRGPVVY